MKKIIFLVFLAFSSFFVGCSKNEEAESKEFVSCAPINITFDGNGGELISGDENQTICNSSEIIAPTYNKKGYKFIGWSENFEDVNEPTSIEAKWEMETYKITYHLNYGVNGDNISEYNVNSVDIALKDASKAGYTFQGWYSESTYENKVTIIDVSALKDYHVYAKFTINQYTLGFNSNGGSPVEPIVQNYNSPIAAPANPTRIGYEFKGWYKDNNTFLDEYEFTTMPLEGIELFAKWEEIYTISYELKFEGIDNYKNPTSYKSSDNDIILQKIECENNKFIGWYTDSNYKNPIKTISKGTTGNIVLYAKWLNDEFGNIAIYDKSDFITYLHENKEEKYKGKNFKLYNNINFNGERWDGASLYQSLFDGNGYSIENFTFSGGGVFHTIRDSTVKNLTIKDATVTGFNYYVGSLAGISTNSNIINCHVYDVNINIATSDYESVMFAGGLVGYVYHDGSNETIISNNHVEGTVSFASQTATVVGGLFGYLGYEYNTSTKQNLITIQNTYTNVNVNAKAIHSNKTSKSYAGGLIGYIKDGATHSITKDMLIIKNCYTSGITKAESDDSGAISGGFVAYIENDMAKIRIESCYVIGDVIAFDSTSTLASAGGIYSYVKTPEALICEDAFRIDSQNIVSKYKNIESGKDGITRYSGTEATSEQILEHISNKWDKSVWNIDANLNPNLINKLL